MASTGPFPPSSTHTGPFPPAPQAPDTPTSVSPVQQPIGALKGHHAQTPQITLDPSLPSPTTAHTPRSPAFKLTPAYSPKPLTGAAAMADARRHQDEQRAREMSRQVSPNPAVNALSSLLGANQLSKVRDAPAAATTLAEPIAKAAKNIQIPESVTGENMQTSPVSVSSFGSVDSTTAPTATASATDTAPAGQLGPAAMSAADGPASSAAPANSGPQPGDGGFANNRSQTFPVPAPADHDLRQPTRMLSMPMAGYSQNNSPRSPSAKRHKCPYCATDFTRHHNLKSHLLTHSQEKPYECPTCQARFRRLHDLKRHTKLHTGERPHTCPKCGRKFARGDALARHNKGQGGCAGRRSSFGIDEDGNEHRGDDMDGVLYHGDGSEDKMDEDGPQGRRVSEPSGKGRQGSQASYHQHSSTYPPIAGRAMGNSVHSMYPPGSGASATSRDQSGHPSPKTGGSSLSSMHYPGQQPPPSVFAQGSMTESPKPISPGQMEAQRHQGILEGTSVPGARSPSMSQQAHQQYQRGAGRGSSPMSLPPPVGNSHAPHLPSLPGLNADMRMSMNKMSSGQAQKQNAQGGPGTSMLHQQVSAPGTASNPGSLSSHGPSSGGSMREYFGGRESDLFAYIRDVETRMLRGHEEANARIAALQEEVAQLRAQLQQQQPSRS